METRLALLWTLLNISTDIDVQSKDVQKIMKAIQDKIGKEECDKFWGKWIYGESFDDKLKIMFQEGEE